MDILRQAVDVIVENRISTTQICDIMGKTGVLSGIHGLNPGFFAAGAVQYVYAHAGTNFYLHEQLARIAEDSVVYVDTFDCGERAVFGDLVSKYLLLYRKSRAIVTCGFMRDANDLIKQRRAVWCAGVTPIGCHNNPVPISESIIQLTSERKKLFDSSIIVCDDSGVALISKEFINDDLIKKLNFIESQEDVWYFCVDTLKWSTYETVALKRYLDEPEVLPSILRKRISEYDL